MKIDEKLLNEIIYILNYFKDGLSDIEVRAGEEQPMLNDIKKVLKQLENK